MLSSPALVNLPKVGALPKPGDLCDLAAAREPAVGRRLTPKKVDKTIPLLAPPADLGYRAPLPGLSPLRLVA